MTTSIDWQRIREKLTASDAATEASLQFGPDRAREVMDARAALLARVPATPVSAADTLEVLTFHLGEEHYALETRLVREVHRQPEVTPLPGTPGFVLGLANLRGEMLAVMDLGVLLAIGAPRREGCPWMIVLGDERAEFGIVGDTVHEVVALHAGDLLAGCAAESAGRQHVRGVTREALIVLDAAALLADPRLFIEVAAND